VAHAARHGHQQLDRGAGLAVNALPDDAVADLDAVDVNHDLGRHDQLASARASELPKTVIHPFMGASVALGRGELRFAPGYHTSDARRPRPTAPPLDSNLTW